MNYLNTYRHLISLLKSFKLFVKKIIIIYLNTNTTGKILNNFTTTEQIKAKQEFENYIIKHFELSVSNITDIEEAEQFFDKYIKRDSNGVNIKETVNELKQHGYLPSADIKEKLI